MRMLIKGKELQDFLSEYDSLALIENFDNSQVTLNLYMFEKNAAYHYLDMIWVDLEFKEPLISKSVVPRIYGEFVDTDFMFNVINTLRNKTIINKIIRMVSPQQTALINGLKNIDTFKNIFKDQIKAFVLNQKQFI